LTVYDTTETPQTTPADRKRSGLAITAFTVAAISLLLCWVPVVNTIVFFLGAIGLALAVPAWLSARHGNRGGKGLAVAAVVVSVLALLGVVATQAYYGKVIEDAAASFEGSTGDLDNALGKNTDGVLAENLDVQLGGFTATEDDVGIVESKLVVTVTNIGAAPVSGELTVVADSTDGSRIAQDYVFIDSLDAGQRIETEAFVLVEADQVEPLKKAVFSVVEASVY
jgi:hypothetical protein